MKKGYVTLMSVVALGALFSVLALLLLNLGLDSGLSSLYWQNELKARSAASACAESALQEIHDSVPFSGSDTITFTDSACSYNVLNLGGQNREILAVGTSHESSFRIKLVIDSITPDINIVSWDELADF